MPQHLTPDDVEEALKSIPPEEQEEFVRFAMQHVGTQAGPDFSNVESGASTGALDSTPTDVAVMLGGAKSIPHTLLGAARAFAAPAAARGALAGFADAGRTGEPSEDPIMRMRQALEPQSGPEQAGFTGGRVLSSMAAAIAAPQAVLPQALAAGGITAAQEGKIGPSALVSGAAGGLLTKIMNAAPGLRERALQWFVNTMQPENRAVSRELANTLRPIASELPAGTRAGVQDVAAQRANVAGEALERFYMGQPGQASLEPAQAYMGEQIGRQVARPGIPARPLTEAELIAQLRGGGPNVGMREGRITLSDVPAVPPITGNPAQLEALEAAQGRLGQMGESLSIPELFQVRRQAGQAARQSANEVFAPGARPGDLSPKAESAMAVQQSLSKALQEAAPAGKPLDEAFHAWKTVSDALGDSERGGQVVRWMIARGVGGGAGTGLGLLVSMQTLRRTLGAKGLRGLATAIEAGNDAHAIELVRGVLPGLLSEDPDVPTLDEDVERVNIRERAKARRQVNAMVGGR